MSAARALLSVLWVGLTLYALLGGADFGAGFWDLRASHRAHELIDTVIGPVWEANNVWLVFVLVVLWTGFPEVFGAVMSTLYIPLTLAALGIIARGSAYAFRHVAAERLFGTLFAASSILTTFFLGTVAGAVASGRVPPGLAAGSLFGSWLNPTSVLGGALGVGTCAYLAAVYLCHDARRTGAPDLVPVFRRRALATGTVVGALALGGIAVLDKDSPALFHGLTHRALPLVVVSGLAGVTSFVLLLVRRYVAARPAAAVAVAAVLWGWAVAQYPMMLPGLPYSRAAAPRPVLTAMLTVTAIGAVLLLPSLGWLFVIFQRDRPSGQRAGP